MDAALTVDYNPSRLRRRFLILLTAILVCVVIIVAAVVVVITTRSTIFWVPVVAFAGLGVVAVIWMLGVAREVLRKDHVQLRVFEDRVVILDALDLPWAFITRVSYTMTDRTLDFHLRDFAAAQKNAGRYRSLFLADGAEGFVVVDLGDAIDDAAFVTVVESVRAEVTRRGIRFDEFTAG